MARTSREFKFSIEHKIKEISQGGSNGEILRLAVINYGAGDRLDIRRWFQPTLEQINDAEQRGKPYNLDKGGFAMGKGISIHPDDFDEFLEALQVFKTEYDEGIIEINS